LVVVVASTLASQSLPILPLANAASTVLLALLGEY
jgi:hypothetical protein